MKGHTYTVVDMIHALIERKRKKTVNMSILTPWDWQQLICQTSSKYSVYNMELENFKQFDLLLVGKESPFVSRKVDVDKEPVIISQCVHLLVKQEKMEQLFFKTSFDEDFRCVDLIWSHRSQAITWPETLSVVSNQKLPISKQKYHDLMSLMSFILTVCMP